MPIHQSGCGEECVCTSFKNSSIFAPRARRAVPVVFERCSTKQMRAVESTNCMEDLLQLWMSEKWNFLDISTVLNLTSHQISGNKASVFLVLLKLFQILKLNHLFSFSQNSANEWRNDSECCILPLRIILSLCTKNCFSNMKSLEVVLRANGNVIE